MEPRHARCDTGESRGGAIVMGSSGMCDLLNLVSEARSDHIREGPLPGAPFH